jgi:hypothetical protein
MWTATNALFARPAVLEVLDRHAGTKRTELDRFRVLFADCSLPSADLQAIKLKLHSILELPMHVEHFPWNAFNTPPTILEVIYFKHTVAAEQARGIGKKRYQAAANNDLSALDLPALIYATRNWNIHGVLLSSSLRGTGKKFEFWIDSINEVLARTLEGSAIALQKAIER